MAYAMCAISWDGTHGICTYDMSWDSTHGILQLHPPVPSHMAYYNTPSWDGITWHITMYTLLRWHTWHITMTPSWDGTHGIFTYDMCADLAHIAYYNDTLLWWHTWHITRSLWDGTHGICTMTSPPEICTHGILQWHPPEMAGITMYSLPWDASHGILQ